MSRNRIIALIIIAFVLVGMFAIARVQSRRKVTKSTAQIQQEVGIPIQTSTVRIGSIEDSIPVTGNLTALDTVTLSSKVPGKVAYVAVREGDKVKRGQVVVQLDRTDAEEARRQASAGLRSAYAGLATADARLSQARTTKSVSDVQSSAAIEQAKAGLAAAEANLQKIRKGARSQERMIAENQVTTAKANLDNAQANLRRTKQLLAQGAVAQAQLDVAQTQYDATLAQFNSAKENLSLVEEGARREDVRAAEAQVQQANEALRTAKANAAQTKLRQEDINTAQAGVLQAKALVTQAEAQVAMAEEQVRNTAITSPIDGIVSSRMTEPGQTASPGVPLMGVVNVRSVYFQADVSETVVSKVRTGQAVNVGVDAYTGQMFVGKVDKINPLASTESRNFRVRIGIPNPRLELKPGMFARGQIVTSSKPEALLVSQDAVEERSGKNIVFTVEGSMAKRHEIRRGLSNPQYVEILPPTDLKSGDQVVTSGHEYLADGKKVKVES